MIQRLFVEKKPGFRQEAESLLRDLREQLEIPGLEHLRIILRYDVQGVPEASWALAKNTVFSEPPVDDVYEDSAHLGHDDIAFAIEYLPGQFDQRADSAAQCVQLVAGTRPLVHTARVIVLRGRLSSIDLSRIKAYLINAVDSREASLDKPSSLAPYAGTPPPVQSLTEFIHADAAHLEAMHQRLGLAMSLRDLGFCQDYFRDQEQRDPTLTEIKVLDTYWSDHCRHTTFLTEITQATIDSGAYSAPIQAAWERYLKVRAAVHGDRAEQKPVCLMDIALAGMRLLRKHGKLPDLEESEEVNAASIVVPAEIDGKTENWLVMFKNETHNHPTEIEPFGGAATCIGGAIRDPLSGRSYVYQAMRVTGAADPRTPFRETLPGKLPQRKITVDAARGYSSYGNQIGLATGSVNEIYHPRYVAKRMEIGAVIAGAPQAQVVRGTPAPGDRIVLLGGRTGRDGIGGATGSSKEHTEKALENSAEVQKGDAPTERKLQRLFRNPAVSRMIKRCNDFGAGGVCVAIGELAPSLRIDLDRVPRKYEGLDGTELAISESQERMAVCLEAADVAAFIQHADAENLEAVTVAEVTDSGRLVMTWRGQTVVDLARAFLDTNGTRATTQVRVAAPADEAEPLYRLPQGTDLAATWLATLGDLNVCSQKGLVERFDSTIGAASVLHPFGGAARLTPTEGMVAKLPLLEGETTTGTVMTHGFNPEIACWSPFHGAWYAILEAVARAVACGADPRRIRLTLQEYFPKPGSEPTRWGLPFAALLGALDAQLGLGLPAIGGKDSMSGTFKHLDVPPTLVAFAVAPTDVRHTRSPEFKRAGNAVHRLGFPRLASGLPDAHAVMAAYDRVHAAIAAGTIVSAQSIRRGGLAAALTKMALGNALGFAFDQEPDLADLFAEDYGALLLETAPGADLGELETECLGTITAEPEIRVGHAVLALDALRTAWTAPLEPIFPTQAPVPAGQPQLHRFEPAKPARGKVKVAKPRVLIPVFPGTNCEYDTARAFRLAGAEPEILVLRNLSDGAVRESLDALVAALNRSQILMLPGGFSAGDEPDGSGKFIATVFRNPAVADATMQLIYGRDGLCLGICNGFQALVKLGLVAFGEIRPLDAECPTLTFNAIQRHVSAYVRTRVVSRHSPWLSRCSLGTEYIVPVSHGEGRFTGPTKVLQELFTRDQVATQYCDVQGQPTYGILENPNGSLHAIEGITSPCGRVYGKMAHSERTGPHVGLNIPGEKYQPIFAGGVDYFG